MSLKKQVWRFTIHRLVCFQHWPNLSFYCLPTSLVWHLARHPLACASISDWRNFRRGWSLNLSRWHHKLMTILFCEDYGKYTQHLEKNKRRHPWGIYLSSRMIFSNYLAEIFPKLTCIKIHQCKWTWTNYKISDYHLI